MIAEKKNYSYALLLFIILLAVFLRFYNYDDRWGLAHDQATFAIQARYALETKSLPLLGPFSSARVFPVHFYNPITIDETGYFLLDLEASSSSDLEKEDWANINPSLQYNSTQSWYKR